MNDSTASDIDRLIPENLNPVQRAYTRRTILRASAMVGLAGVSASFLAACSPQSGGGATPAPDGGGGEIKPGGILRYGVASGDPGDVLDPHYPLTGFATWAGMALYEPLTWTNDDFEFEQVLTESWTPNDDATEWTMKLKPGVVFHDGKPVTAADVVFTVNRILDPDGGAIAAGNFSMVDSMEVVDDQTLLWKLNAPTGWFPISVGDGGAMGVVPDGFDVNNPVSTGPFKFKSFTPGSETIWERFDDYHGTPAIVDEFHAIALPDNDARVNALIAGQVDAIQNVPAASIAQLNGDGAHTVDVLESGQFMVLTMRVDQGVTADVDVRQAVRMAVDREQILNIIYGGNGEIANDLYGRWDPAFDDSLVRDHDVEGAKALIAKAGAAGKEFVISTPAQYKDTCQIIAESANEIGLNASVDVLDDTSFYQKYTEWDIATDWYPSTTILTTAAMSDGPGAFLNQTHFDDAEYNDLFVQASSAIEDADRVEPLKKMQRILFDRGGYLIAVWEKTLNARALNTAGWPTADRSGFGVFRAFGRVGFTS